MLKRVLFAAALAAGLGAGTAQAQSTPFVGQVMIFSGNFCPMGWVPMEGQLLPISQYVVLFNIVGTTYGGDGKTNFALPKAKPFTTFGGKQTLMQCIAYLGVFPART
ncbi:MAG TPA: tail fiber protein [Rhizomicrobium sp.]|nr:tail fiber protein [Rhizomicrobium sp.]